MTFALPFGCVTAIAAHLVRFGNEHAFGGAANEAINTAAIGGSLAIALVVLHAFLTAGTTTITGTIACARSRRLLPNAAVIFTIAAAVYYGIESLEGNGIEFGLPTLLLAVIAAFLAFALQRIVACFAQFASALVREWLARLDAQPRIVWCLACLAQPLHAQPALVARRFGRAPPNGRRTV